VNKVRFYASSVCFGEKALKEAKENGTDYMSTVSDIIEAFMFKYNAKDLNNFDAMEFEVSEESYVLICLTEPELVICRAEDEH
jgi:hypothetical protein